MKKVKYSMILAGILCALTAFGCDEGTPSDQLCKETDGSVTRCSTCTIDDPSNPPRRCVDDPETGIGQIEVCNGRFYEVEIIPVNPEDPDSAMKRNVCNNVSCKAGAVECGQCNNIIPKICENDYGNNADLYKTMGHVYSCTGGMKLEEKACRPSESSSDWYSCNADGTDCGVCMNGKQDSCVNDSRGYGYVDICKNGEYVNQKCERDLSCLGDGSGCKLCRYYSNAAENESTCNAAMSKPPYKLVCTESGTWDISECGRNEYCVVRSSGDGGYKAVCSL